MGAIAHKIDSRREGREADGFGHWRAHDPLARESKNLNIAIRVVVDESQRARGTVKHSYAFAIGFYEWCGSHESFREHFIKEFQTVLYGRLEKINAVEVG